MFNAYSSLAVPTININKPRSLTNSPKSRRRQDGCSPMPSPNQSRRLLVIEMGGEAREDHAQMEYESNLQDVVSDK